MPHTLRTERLLLTPARLRDGGDLARAINDWAVLRETGTWAYPSDADATRRRLRFAERYDPREDIVFVVRRGGHVAGTAGLHRQTGATFEIGYMLGRAYWGQGLATEAARAVCAFGFAALRAREITACAYVGNPGSGRVLEKVGFRALPGTRPGWSAARGASAPMRDYRLVREGWAGAAR